MTLPTGQDGGATDASSPPRAALEALETKYLSLVRLRATRDETRPFDLAGVKPTLKALAAAFPGCLRELDRLRLSELERRHTEVRQALAGGAALPWMLWMWEFHTWLGAALALKQGRPLPQEIPLTAEFRDAVRRPPRGRLVPLVIEVVAQRLGVPADELATTLFPPRRAAGPPPPRGG
ncbi:MAG: hypothetical protein KA712_15885 [Myxococcales bacterium]|nr:hypothetical protein [Myxococcales bacterium]